MYTVVPTCTKAQCRSLSVTLTLVLLVFTGGVHTAVLCSSQLLQVLTSHGGHGAMHTGVGGAALL